MLRKIIKIDVQKCNGCGLCATACHEGAIGMIDGKATLLREDYCDGLGDCLPTCPTGAISFEEREAPAYDKKAVLEAQTRKTQVPKTPVLETQVQETQKPEAPLPCGCPGTNSKVIEHTKAAADNCRPAAPSRLSQWPVQIKLVPVKAPYFENANLLIAADCTAYAYGNFYNEFIKNRITLIGCPKLDMVDYTEKLTQIISENDIKSVTVVRMEVPCCVGIENAVKQALMNSGKFIPWNVVTISTEGDSF